MLQDWSKYVAGSASTRVPVESPKMIVREIEENVNSDTSLLKAIYAIDPVSKAPTGDIACYVSSKTSPEVKKYILDNLMMDTSQDAMPAAPVGMSDSDILNYQRGRNESFESYVNRLSEYARVNAKFVADAKSSVSSSDSKE